MALKKNVVAKKRAGVTAAATVGAGGAAGVLFGLFATAGIVAAIWPAALIIAAAGLLFGGVTYFANPVVEKRQHVKTVSTYFDSVESQIVARYNDLFEKKIDSVQGIVGHLRGNTPVKLFAPEALGVYVKERETSLRLTPEAAKGKRYKSLFKSIEALSEKLAGDKSSVKQQALGA